MKARLPVLSGRPEPSSQPTAHAAESAPDAERLTAGRALLCISDAGAPELALQFAGRLLGALRARGRDVAALCVAANGEAGAGDARRIRELGVDALFVLEERALPDAALAVFTTLPSQCIVVGLGSRLAAHFAPLLSVRLSRTLPVAARGLVDADVELGPGMEGAATLIGDWLAARIPSGFARGCLRLTHEAAARAWTRGSAPAHFLLLRAVECR